MITIPVSCIHCGGVNLTHSGHALNVKQKYFKRKYLSHDCGKNSRHNPGSNAYPDAFRQHVLASYNNRCSLRGVCRIFGVSRNTMAKWLKYSH